MITTPDYQALLQTAIAEARQGLAEGGVPIGAALYHNDGRLLGSVRLWNVSAGGVSALLLGPLAVDPAAQGLGVGSALMRRALNRAAALGHAAVLLDNRKSEIHGGRPAVADGECGMAVNDQRDQDKRQQLAGEVVEERHTTHQRAELVANQDGGQRVPAEARGHGEALVPAQ